MLLTHAITQLRWRTHILARAFGNRLNTPEPLVQLSSSDMAMQKHLLHQYKACLEVAQLLGVAFLQTKLRLAIPHPSVQKSF